MSCQTQIEEKKPKSAGPSKRRRAAMYVRSATISPNQLEEQKRTILEYAERNDMDVVAVYADEGKCGLTMCGRPGLRRLLLALRSGSPGFSAILLRDISRWGRFQDPRSLVFCERACSRVGVSVHYVSEPSQNTDTVSAMGHMIASILGRGHQQESVEAATAPRRGIKPSKLARNTTVLARKKENRAQVSSKACK